MGVSTRNWAGNQRCVPAAVHEPTSTDEVAAIVLQAAESGQRVKAIGGGHSFTDAAMTDGHLVSLDGMNRILEVDGTDVTVQAGIRLHELNAALFERGLALPNLGDIDKQSIAGATSTATHGTGIRPRQPGDDDRRPRARDGRRFGGACRRARPTPNCCAWPVSGSAHSVCSPK